MWGNRGAVSGRSRRLLGFPDRLRALAVGKSAVLATGVSRSRSGHPQLRRFREVSELAGSVGGLDFCGTVVFCLKGEGFGRRQSNLAVLAYVSVPTLGLQSEILVCLRTPGCPG